MEEKYQDTILALNLSKWRKHKHHFGYFSKVLSKLES